METSFARVIDEHLELKRRHSGETGGAERQPDARNEAESDRSRDPAVADEAILGASENEDSLWGRAREFDWGD